MNNLSIDGTEDDNQPVDDEDQWQLYASSGYGNSIFLSEDISIEKNVTDEEWFDGDDFDTDNQSLNWDAPPCPAPLGISHVIKMGICNYCLSRISGLRNNNYNTLSGTEIREQAVERDSELSDSTEEKLCPFCENLFDDVENISKRVLEGLEGIEVNTIQFGIHMPKDLIQEEDRIRTKYGAPGSLPLKSALVQEIHSNIKSANDQITFVKERPNVMVLVDALTLRADIDIRPAYLYGRYRKFERGIPQTRWPCRACRGRGKHCTSCNETGLQYTNSVQDLIGEPIREVLKGSDTSFHGMGREDIDVRCLGGGRPFVIEIKRPELRNYSAEKLQKIVNSKSKKYVEVAELQWCEKKRIVEVKESRTEKSYTIRFKLTEDKEIDIDEIKDKIHSLSGQLIQQQTPKRVSHRRSDIKRERKIISINDVIIEEDEIQLSLRCEAGTYVKELIHSDDGRTKPSVSGIIDSKCEVIWLDVIDIHYD